ncbi:MAG: UDP-glucose 4-epimerase [Alphaproteobacteria bacterium]|nr:MAG: UDP-glucose 4-epimerase [Alphaproteobacteria bacterium]
MEKVLVTGATGFIGLHCIAQLLQQGYSVTGTVRSPNRIEEVKQAISEQQLSTENLSFVEADLTKDEGWDKAVAGCDYVLHVASPFIVGVPKHEDELIIPAVEGTRRVIEAAINEDVKKVVQTSSCAAIIETHNGKTHFTEDDWTDASHPKTPAYYKSKTLAEQKAWELIGAQSTTKLAVINPAGVFGPTLSDDIGVANEFVLQVIDGKVPGCPKLHLGFVDVRDVAAAHILAMQKPEADGERFIISEREYWFREFSAVLRAAGYEKAPSREMPNWLVKFLGLFDPATKQMSQMIGKEKITPSEKAKKLLGWKPRPADESLRDTAAQIVEKGMVKL